MRQRRNLNIQSQTWFHQIFSAGVWDNDLKCRSSKCKAFTCLHV